jgi:hypothetical protein
MRRQRLDQLLEALERLAPHLRAYSNVEHVDVGYRYVKGRLTRQLAIRVFIRGRKVRSGRKARLLPATLEGLPIDVVAADMKAHGRAGAASAAPAPPALTGGVSIGTRVDPPGTLGSIVRLAGNEGAFGLTSGHVVRAGADVYALAGAGAERVGAVETVDYSQGAALVRVDVPCQRPGARSGLGAITGTVPPATLRDAVARCLQVEKSGATTQVTRARLTGLAGDELTLSAERLGQVIAEGGDSGAIWTLLDGRAVGLHFGGGGAGAFARARPMCDVVEAMGIAFA